MNSELILELLGRRNWFDPKRLKVRTYPVVIEDGETLAKGPYVAETFPVHVEDSYVIIET